MDPSYSLHARIPVEKKAPERRRKRKVIQMDNHLNAYKYTCYQCSTDVYFLPGHELVCTKCSSRIVEKPSHGKRWISAR